MKNCIWFFSFLLVFSSCEQDRKIPDAIASIPVSLEVVRFDSLFAAADMEKLPQLKKDFPYLFAKQYNDTYWAQKFQDSLQQEINDEVASAFPELDDELVALERLFKHIKYFYPEQPDLKVITITSEVDYRNKVILADSLLLIALDTYLGPEHFYYGNIPKYQSRYFDRERMVLDVAEAFALQKIPRPKGNTFLSQLIYEGKVVYMMEQLLSLHTVAEVMGYTEEEYDFAQANEKNMWEYFVSRELLYSTDRKLGPRFLYPAPFSKFYLEFDNETPGRLGRYLGYQIVAAYMEKNEVPLKTMLVQDADTIFANAKYKP